MDPTLMLTAAWSLGGLALILAMLLAVANRKLHVQEDPRIDQVEDMLPHANCGACGFPGCRPFAEALVKAETSPAECSVSSPDSRFSIASYLGVSVGEATRKVARLACAGGVNVSRVHALYQGQNSCRGAALIGGGGKGCAWGCLGFGDCFDVCDFNAIGMNSFQLPVVSEDLCTACNACVEICPKNLFSLQPQTRQLWVACKSLEKGDVVLRHCEVGCTACGKCVMDAPNGQVAMHQNLPVVDYSKQESKAPIGRCPTGAIVWLDPELGVVKGHASPQIARTSPMPPASTWD